MIPVDLVGAIRAGLEKDRRPPDGLLHCSSDILGSLRHAQLRLAGAPELGSDLVQDVRLKTGTMWHELIAEKFLHGMAVMSEISVTPFLPEGWAGTADWLFWDWDKRCFVLGDLKTIKGEGMTYIERDGAKAEHIYQLSAYYHALVDAGMPMRKGFFICYLPMNADTQVELTEPVLIDCVPVNRHDLWLEMDRRWLDTKTYLENLVWGHPGTGEAFQSGAYPASACFVTPELAPPSPREQKLFWDKKAKRYDLKLVPSWKTRYCPYPNELCDCSEQGTTKVGHYELNDDITYVPRDGFEEVAPTVAPQTDEFERRLARAV